MQTSTTVAAPATSAAAGQRPGGTGLAVATAAVAFASAALTIVAIFPHWDATTTLHDTFADLESNLLFAAVLVVAGIFLLVSRRQWVRAAAALLLAGSVVGYLPQIGSNVGTVLKDGSAAAGFWIGQFANLAGVVAAAMALVFAFRSGKWSWRPSDHVQSPVLMGAIGFLGVLMALAWTLSVSKVFDASNELVTEQFGPLASRLPDTAGFVIGATLVVLTLLVVVCTRPAPLSGFLLMGLTVAGVSDIFAFDLWGFDASQGGTAGPGPGSALMWVVTLGLLFVAVVLATDRVDSETDSEADAATATPAIAAYPTEQPAYPVEQPAYLGTPQAAPAAEPAPAPAPPPPPAPPVPSPETQAVLAQLEDLHARGLLSDAEYAAKRAQALGG